MKTLTRPAHFVALLGMVLFSLITAASVFAQTGTQEPVSAPQVVAPAQPAGANTAGGTTNTLTTASAPQAAAATPQTPGGMLQMALPLIIMMGVMYFIAIRPQQKKVKAHQQLMTDLQNGDEVVTNSGILGTITGMSDKVVNLEVAKNVQIKVLKSQVNQVVKGSVQDIQA